MTQEVFLKNGKSPIPIGQLQVSLGLFNLSIQVKNSFGKTVYVIKGKKCLLNAYVQVKPIQIERQTGFKGKQMRCWPCSDPFLNIIDSKGRSRSRLELKVLPRYCYLGEYSSLSLFFPKASDSIDRVLLVAASVFLNFFIFEKFRA